jgi:DNA-binding transcriptional LysR family regulator
MKIRQIEAFEAVMQSRSMTLAGKILFITQPAVSRLIIELEEEVGFKLFERKKSGLLPTVEGLLLYEEVEKSLIGLKQISKTAESIKFLRKGQLRIIAMPAVTNLFLPGVVKIFWSQFPDINLEIESYPRTSVLDWIHSNQYDVGIVNLPIDDSEVCLESVFDLKMFCVIAEDHHLSKKDVLNINDLKGENFVSFPLGTYLRHEIDLLLAKNRVNCRTKLETRSQTDIYQYVKHGAGVSLVFPFNQFEHSSFPGLLFKPLNIDFKIGIAVIRSKRRKPSLATQNFIRVVKKLVES